MPTNSSNPYQPPEVDPALSVAGVLDDALKTQVAELGKCQTPEMVIVALKSSDLHNTIEEALTENQEAVEQQFKNCATIAEVWPNDEMLESEFVKEYSELFKAAVAV